MQNPDCWIFIGGECPEASLLADFLPPSLIIAADSGYQAAVALGYMPDIAVGDFDSVALSTIKQKIPKERIFSFPKDKDESDTELALHIAQQQGAISPLLIGGGGKRTDHLLAIVKIFSQAYIPSLWLTKYETIFLIKNEVTLEKPIGTTLSFFPLQNPPCNVTSQGLVWELNSLNWNQGGFSLSNRIQKNPTVIHCQGGDGLLVLIPHPYVL